MVHETAKSRDVWLLMAKNAEADGDIEAWRYAMRMWLYLRPPGEMLPIEIDVSDRFHRLLIDSMDAILPTDHIRFCTVPLVVREYLPFAEEIAA